MAKKIVKFLKGHSRYNKGDVAGFDEEFAKSLCKGKDPIAEMIGDPDPAPVLAAPDASGDDELAALQADVAHHKAENAALKKAVEDLTAEVAKLQDEAIALKAAAKTADTSSGTGTASRGQPPKTK